VLTYTQVLFRSVKISLILVVVDTVSAFLLRGFIHPVESFGDMLLVETALLFVFAGFVDLGTSVAFVQFRRSVFASREAFSAQKRKEAERRAIALIASGAILFAIMIISAIFGR